MKYEIRIRPVIRYMVSEYHEAERDERLAQGSRSLGEFASFGQAKEIADLVAGARGGEVISEESSDYGVAETIGNLMALLGMFDPHRTPVTIEPPFTGVRVIPQESGSILIAPPPREKRAPKALGEE